MKTQSALFVLNEPHVLRISPALAKEIGLNESILFLQIEYLIRISTTEEIDGRDWTYQSLQKMHDDFFPWWSVTTISRIAKSLEEMELILIGNFNLRKYDRTQWYALNEVGINRLQSIQLNTAIFQNEKWNMPNCKMDNAKLQNAIRQNEKPIPETPTETPTDIKVSPVANVSPSVSEVAVQSWEQLRKTLKLDLSGPNYKAYVEPLRLVDYRNGGTRAHFVLAAPDEEKREWAEDRLGQYIRRFLAGSHDGEISLEFVLQKQE